MHTLNQLVEDSKGRIKMVPKGKTNWLKELVKKEELSSFKMAQEWAYGKFYKRPSQAVEMVDLFKKFFGVTEYSHCHSIEELVSVKMKEIFNQTS